MILEDGSELLLIHLALPESDRVACAPHMAETCAQPMRAWPYQRTGDPRAVTCPYCKETPDYATAAAPLQALGALKRR